MIYNATPIPNALYVGLALHYDYPTRYGMYIHDGFWSWDFHAEQDYESDSDTDSDSDLNHENIVGARGEVTVSDGPLDVDALHTTIINFVKKYEEEKQCKILMAGLVNCKDVESLHKLGVMLWKEADVIPAVITATGSSLDEKACSVARKTSQWLYSGPIPGLVKLNVGYRHEVEVDANRQIVIADLESYKSFTTPETWNALLDAAESVKKKNLKIVYFNSTPQGGGVAIIRHSTLRLFHLLGVSAHWFVMKPNPVIFEITKKKFHNVLQGVAPEGTHLREKDKKRWEKWCKYNLDTYWRNGPVKEASVIVIDDPQPCGMIPYLKKLNPQAKIVYRSHIELRSDLIRQEGTEQHDVWNFLWSKIKDCDVFVTHPVDKFVPDNVKESGIDVVQMPAITDPVDGLNKSLSEHALSYYRLLFNRMSFDQTGMRADFTRPYFIQIARFDPSKGIPDLIKAYVEFRMLMELEDGRKGLQDIPQLLITGHGSIDDPEGSVVHDEVLHLVAEMGAKSQIGNEIAKDIVVVRLGPSDQMLNALLTSALVAFQLSHREGFEIKITEALLKGVPVVAYRAGGIPLQIQEGRDGLLYEVGDIEGVANAMYKFVTESGYRKQMSENALKLTMDCKREWLLTPMNNLKWMRLLNDGGIPP